MPALRRYPLVVFFVLTYVLTWAAIPFIGFFTAGPFLAALSVIP